MLVLTRKKNEVIRIGDDIEVMIVEIRGDKVKLGIKAPPEVMVHRQEVYELIQQQKEQTQERDETDESTEHNGTTDAA